MIDFKDIDATTRALIQCFFVDEETARRLALRLKAFIGIDFNYPDYQELKNELEGIYKAALLAQFKQNISELVSSIAQTFQVDEAQLTAFREKVLHFCTNTPASSKILPYYPLLILHGPSDNHPLIDAIDSIEVSTEVFVSRFEAIKIISDYMERHSSFASSLMDDMVAKLEEGNQDVLLSIKEYIDGLDQAFCNYLFTNKGLLTELKQLRDAEKAINSETLKGVMHELGGEKSQDHEWVIARKISLRNSQALTEHRERVETVFEKELQAFTARKQVIDRSFLVRPLRYTFDMVMRGMLKPNVDTDTMPKKATKHAGFFYDFQQRQLKAKAEKLQKLLTCLSRFEDCLAPSVKDPFLRRANAFYQSLPKEIVRYLLEGKTLSDGAVMAEHAARLPKNFDTELNVLFDNIDTLLTKLKEVNAGLALTKAHARLPLKLQARCKAILGDDKKDYKKYLKKLTASEVIQLVNDKSINEQLTSMDALYQAAATYILTSVWDEYLTIIRKQGIESSLKLIAVILKADSCSTKQRENLEQAITDSIESMAEGLPRDHESDTDDSFSLDM